MVFKTTFSQVDTLKEARNKKRKVVLSSSAIVLTTGSLLYLNQAWYADYTTSHFHFFNDNGEWLQMDKLGHTFTTYQTSRLMMNAFEWAGFSKNKSLWIGGTMGFAYMSVIECMDGFSTGWGFSWGDMGANALGTSLAISQQAFWKEQRVLLKFSYNKSNYAQYNPSLLGKDFSTQLLKDYNGQNYWLSINPSAFMAKETKFPKWLNVALGYNANGMIGGFTNKEVTDKNGNSVRFERQRHYYLSLDIDLSRIKTKSKLLKGIFSVFNMLKIPAPALEFSGHGLKFRPIYF